MQISGSVIVVTGAASGIGRATSLALAHKNAKLVLAVRNDEVISDLLAECDQLGAEPIVVKVDTAEREQVDEVARKAIEAYGTIDAWINNAACFMVGRFDQVPPDDYHRLLEINVLGYMHGARAAL